VKTITFKGQDYSGDLTVQDCGPKWIELSIDDEGRSVKLNAVQADKLRQVFHGWLHERALGEDGVNWVEEGEPSTPAYPTLGFPVRE
jgi:hypothetical protein